MKRRGFSKNHDFFAAILSIGIGLAASYAFFLQANGTIESAHSLEVEVGDLSSIHRGVRYRLNKSITWQDVPSEEKKKIRMGDEVFTTSQSTAMISLKDGTAFTIDPNSYVAFEKMDRDPSIASPVTAPMLSIKKGSVQFHLSPNGKNSYLIEVAGKLYSLSRMSSGDEGTITLSIDEKSNQPKVIEKNIKVSLKAVHTFPDSAVKFEEASIQDKGDSKIRLTLSSFDEGRTPASESKPTIAASPITPNSPNLLVRDEAPRGNPLPISTPIATQTKDTEDPSLAKSSITAGLGATYFRIDGVDPNANGKSVVLSELSPKLELQWNLDWDERNTFSFYGALERFTLKSFKNTQTLASTQGFRSAMGVGYLNHWNTRLTLGATIQMKESIFFRSSTPTLLDVNKILIVSPGLNLRYELLKKRNASVGLIEEFGFLFPNDAGDYTIKSGFNGTTGAFIQYRSRNNDRGMEGQIFYRYESQDSSISTRVETNLGMRLLYFWSLD